MTTPEKMDINQIVCNHIYYINQYAASQQEVYISTNEPNKEELYAEILSQTDEWLNQFADLFD